MSDASNWYVANVLRTVQESATAKTFTLQLPHTVDHLPGQHYEIRLTAEGGYQAARLYSAASAADGSNTVELTIAKVSDGEVTPYLIDHLSTGDQLEVRGPLGKFFVWDASTAGSTLLIAGGSGVVPMRAILQAHTISDSTVPMRLLYASRTYDDILYKDYLLHDDRVTIALSHDAPDAWSGHTGRIDQALLQSVLDQVGSAAMCYVCGMTPFVEAMTQLLIAIGVPAGQIRAERYGSS